MKNWASTICSYIASAGTLCRMLATSPAAQWVGAWPSVGVWSCALCLRGSPCEIPHEDSPLSPTYQCRIPPGMSATMVWGTVTYWASYGLPQPCGRIWVRLCHMCMSSVLHCPAHWVLISLYTHFSCWRDKGAALWCEEPQIIHPSVFSMLFLLCPSHHSLATDGSEGASYIRICILSIILETG
jgi:hypothetical protein